MLAYVDPFQQIGSRGWPIETPKYVHEGRLTAAAGAHDGNEFAASNFQAYAAQRVNTGLTQFVVLMQIVDADDRVRSGLRRMLFGLTGGERFHDACRGAMPPLPGRPFSRRPGKSPNTKYRRAK